MEVEKSVYTVIFFAALLRSKNVEFHLRLDHKPRRVKLNLELVRLWRQIKIVWRHNFRTKRNRNICYRLTSPRSSPDQTGSEISCFQTAKVRWRQNDINLLFYNNCPITPRLLSKRVRSWELFTRVLLIDILTWRTDGFGVELSRRTRWVLCTAHVVLVWSNLVCLIVHSQPEQMNFEILSGMDPWHPVSWERQKLLTLALLHHLQWRPERFYWS